MHKSKVLNVGDGVTAYYYSDSKAGTVVDVSASGKVVKVQRDKAVLLNGPDSGEEDALVFHAGGYCAHVSGRQRYSYETDPKGSVSVYSLRKNGFWVRKGDSAKNGTSLGKGRHEHYDYNF